MQNRANTWRVHECCQMLSSSSPEPLLNKPSEAFCIRPAVLQRVQVRTERKESL